MTRLDATSDGNTPLTDEELRDLIPNLATKEELNEWEQQNILFAREWAIRDRTSPVEMATDDYARKLHEKMFDQTWRSAEKTRAAKKTTGYQSKQNADG